VRFVSVVAFAALIAAVAGCGDAPSLPSNPTGPTGSVQNPPVPPLPPTPPPVPGVSSAVLAISNARAIQIPPSSNGTQYSYPVKFLLSETTGTSGATITSVRISSVFGSEETGPLCWRTPIRVAPGGTLATFDAGWDDLAYCAPSAVPGPGIASASIIVTYQDDEGRAGSLSTTAAVTK
jgi:hypothetical protein